MNVPLEFLIVSLITLARLSAMVLFIQMIWKPSMFNTRWKVFIVVMALLAFLPINARRLFR